MTDQTDKVNLTNEEIIHLYENGLSQKDIFRMYGTPIEKIRSILQEAGFHTAIYRKLPLEYEQVICILLQGGFSCQRIADVTDISYHVIRSVADRHRNKTSKKTRTRKLPVPTEREAMFLQHYRIGQCFCALSVYLGLLKKEILNCFTLLDDPAIQAHRRALHSCLEKEDLQQSSISSLARKYGISTSTIKAHLNI